jgi:predicted nucleotidyltransferase
MGYVDEAFVKLKQALEITKGEREGAQRGHEQIRDHVRTSWDLEDDFLTGSYRRETKTKRLKDVDIFVVVDRVGAQRTLRKKNPGAILRELEGVLKERYDNVDIAGMACVVGFGTDDDVMSFDVVPAFKRQTGGYEIPDTKRSTWLATNPKTHHELSTAKNKACDEKFVPFVKMVKGINRELDEPMSPSFLLEVMAQGLVKEPFGRYQDEVRWFLASACERLGEVWPDPAGLGPDVNTMTASERATAEAALDGALSVAERAIGLEDNGHERAAVDEWRRLFGWRMPRP